MATDAPQPQLRASDADREAAADRLQAAAVEGRLDADELDQRLGEVYAARFCTDLTRLTADVTPPAPPPAPAPAAMYAPAPAAATTNGLAIAAFVAGFFWFAWLGSVCAVIFGHVALRQIKDSGGRQSGSGFAVAGLVLGYLQIAGLLFVVAGLS